MHQRWVKENAKVNNSPTWSVTFSAVAKTNGPSEKVDTLVNDAQENRSQWKHRLWNLIVQRMMRSHAFDPLVTLIVSISLSHAGLVFSFDPRTANGWSFRCIRDSSSLLSHRRRVWSDKRRQAAKRERERMRSPIRPLARTWVTLITFCSCLEDCWFKL